MIGIPFADERSNNGTVAGQIVAVRRDVTDCAPAQRIRTRPCSPRSFGGAWPTAALAIA